MNYCISTFTVFKNDDNRNLLRDFGFREYTALMIYSAALKGDELKVFNFLLKHKIPFEADCHNYIYSYIYDGGNHIIKAVNYGEILKDTKDFDTLSNYITPFEKINVQDILDRKRKP